MKKLTIGVFAWAVTSAVLLAGLSQAGERVMRPEFGAGLKAAEAPEPAPTTGPGGEEIFTDESGRIPGATEEESGDIRFGDAIRGKIPSSEKKKDKKAARKRRKKSYSDDEDEDTRKKTPPWLFPDDDTGKKLSGGATKERHLSY